jgi:NADH dehydrogenase FAD-containing subunit/site-specific recombinase XerD/uncharacterized membrane protein YphA (DoxX/SURF4 family)
MRSLSPLVNIPGDCSRRSAFRLVAPLVAIAVLLLFTHAALAHEQWIVTPEQMREWNAQPKPSVYTSWSAGNITLLLTFSLFIIGWVRLGHTGARELFPDLQVRLASYGDFVAPILRFCVAWMLLSAAFGLDPRVGAESTRAPTLFAPDLELRLLAPAWAWLTWAEIVIALALLLGVYVRFFALLLLLLAFLSTWLFGMPMLSYAGALIGTCIYLVMQGPSRYFLPLPTPRLLTHLQSCLDSQPRQRAQAILRVLTGATVLYLGIRYKVLQPNLMVGIIKTYNVSILSMAPETFTLVMALVEVTAGILIIAGILLRPLSLFFLFAFLFFATLLPESYMAHVLFYGAMLSMLFNGAGHWRVPEARDKAVDIVIIGGGISAISAAMYIEKLIGPYTRVRVTLVHDSSDMLFYTLLPEVIGGKMQPGHVVNPIRRIIPFTRVLNGRLDLVDAAAKRVVISRKNGDKLVLRYDQLIVALFLEPSLDFVPGMATQAHTIDSVGDALHIRKRIFDLIQDAEFAEDTAERRRLLTFAVVGSGQRACATAVEMCALLRTAEASYPVLREQGWQVHLYEDSRELFSDFEAQIQARRDRQLKKAGIKLCGDDQIAGVTDRSITLANGERRAVGMVINAAFKWPAVRLSEQVVRLPPDTGAHLGLKGHEDIWVPDIQHQGERQRFMTAADRAMLGRTVGYNAWARSQNYPPRPYRLPKRLFRPYHMGQQSLCSVVGLLVGRTPGRFLSRLTNLAVLPGLERNLRILIDWLLHIPFRNDIAVLSPTLPAATAAVGARTSERFIDFFTANIRNRNTRMAYAAAVRHFFDWCEQRGLQLEAIRPTTVAAYIEQLGADMAKPVKQHLAAIHQLFDYLVRGGLLLANPAGALRGPQYVVDEYVVKDSKTPILSAQQALELLESIDVTELIGLRDRAMIGVLVYTFASVSTVTRMRVEDYFEHGKRVWLRLPEKGRKRHEVPCHHNLTDYLDAWVQAANIGGDKQGMLFRAICKGNRNRLTGNSMTREEVMAMIKGRAANGRRGSAPGGLRAERKCERP